MKHIGLTGNIGSGKTTVSNIFRVLGVPVYCADEKAKSFLETRESIEQISVLFGVDYINGNGLPDRQKIAGLVFNDRAKLKMLEAIIHPQVRNDFVKWSSQQQSCDYVIMEAAILFETGQTDNFDQIVLVTAPEQKRIERVCKRDAVSREQVLQRMRNQLNEDFKIPLADYVIVNDEKNMLIPQVQKVHKAVINHCRNRNNDEQAK